MESYGPPAIAWLIDTTPYCDTASPTQVSESSPPLDVALLYPPSEAASLILELKDN